MDNLEQMIRNAKLAEIMRMRKPENEFDSALELVRPESQSSKYFSTDKNGQVILVPTKFSELITKDAATANFKLAERIFTANWAHLSLFCQFITEASDGKIDLTNVQRFDATKAGINNVYSKSDEGSYAQLVRTQRSENIATTSNFELQKKNQGLRLIPGQQ